MSNLFLSFTIAIGTALGLVSLSRTFDLEFYTTRIFPLVPLFYAIAYELLERRKTGRARPIHPTKAKEEMKTGAKKLFETITPGRILTAIGISLGIKLIFEILFVAMYIRFSGLSFASLYGTFGIETIGRFLRGEHPWLAGNEGFYLLALLAVITSFGTGLWIGYTSRGRAILEGVLVGATVTLISSMTNMLILYRKIEEMANQMAASMGHAMRIGFVVVLSLQVLFYGLWSSVAEKAKKEREALAAAKRPVKKQKK